MAEDMYVPLQATTLRSEEMTETERFFEFKLDSGEPLGHEPGQFAEVSIPGIGEAPISISSSSTRSDTFEMVVRNVGNVSNGMHQLSKGDKIGIRGPFGKGFPVEEDMKGKDLLFICGGIGLVPVRSAIQHVLDNRSDYGSISILFGAKSPSERLFVDELAEWKEDDKIDCFMETVDKGDESWAGNVGLITTCIPKVDHDISNTKVIICGPPVMYKFVLIELEKLGFSHDDIFVSLERRMKCGVGLCGHCQINGYYVCQDGPVFKYSDIEDEKGAI
ncbi:MAG: FAD/NAD(P)-binding protein [Candidatus Krumholzibacteriota bacterium]|nr:FAD/NAD(P)-binding protein [Candidatus Krumholzibacteriota bacterium]